MSKLPSPSAAAVGRGFDGIADSEDEERDSDELYTAGAFS